MKRKNLYPFYIAFILLIAVIVINLINSNKIKEYTAWVDHTRVVITAFEQLSDHFKSAQIYTPTYADSADKNFYASYKKEAESIRDDLSKLKELVKDNAVQKKRMDTLSQLINQHMGILMEKNIAEIVQSGQAWRLHEFYNIHEIIHQSIELEKTLLAVRKLDLEHSTRNSTLLTIVFSIIATGIIVLSLIFNVSLTRRRNWLEDFLQSVLNTSQNGIVTYKAIRRGGSIIDFKIEFANAAVEKLLGLKPKDVVGKRLKQMPSYVVEAGFLQKYTEVVETGVQLEFETLYKQNNHAVWLNVILAKLEDGLTATFHNITELKKYQEELKTKIQQLEGSNRQLEQFAYVASHDLQEPLRKIRTFSDRLQTQKTELNAQSQMWLDKIVTSASRMSTLIKDLLNYSRLTQNKEKEFIKVDLNYILKNVLSDLDLAIQQKEAHIKAEPLPVIDAIELQMNQLFYNLLSNSLKFAAKDRQLQICITASFLPGKEKERLQLDNNKEYTQIIFRDNGIGFKENFAEQIFIIFQRLNSKETYPGTGIGLALCRKVAENHHGLIYAEGKEHEGAKFVIILPVKQDKR